MTTTTTHHKLGILGGTFDPPHVGHLILGETARQELGLDRVLFLPAGQPPHKRGRTVSPAADRVVMTQLAITGNQYFSLDTIDVDRPPPHYTVTLLTHLQQLYPEKELWFLIGGDSLRDLPSWNEPEEIVTNSRLAVLPRPGAVIDWAHLEKAVPGVRRAVTILEGPSVAVSSTQLRRWAARGRSLRYLLPDKVALYIHQKQLYGPNSG